MRLAPERAQGLLQGVERGAGQADDLPAFLDEVDALQPAQAHEDDLPVVVVAPGSRSARQASIRRLEDHDPPGRNRRLQNAPLFDEAAGAHHRGDPAAAVAKPRV